MLRSRATTIIGYVGVMGPQDGVDYLLRALHHLVANLGRADFLCFIVGQGDAVPQLRQLAKELGLDEHVWFTAGSRTMISCAIYRRPTYASTQIHRIHSTTAQP